MTLNHILEALFPYEVGFVIGVALTLWWSWSMGKDIMRRILETTTPAQLAEWQQKRKEST